MRHAETVTFGGSGMDRAAHLRGDAARIGALWRDPGARVVPIWRGKPSVDGSAALGWVATDHPALVSAGEPAIFIGLDDGGPRFALDLSGWAPADGGASDPGAFLDATEQRHPDLPADHRFVELRGVMADLSPRDAECAATARALIGWHGSHRFCSACGARSEVAMAGWQRICGACGAQHFPRTDPVVIMLVTRGNNVLLGRSPGWPEGMFSCLAGFMEPGEPMESTGKSVIKSVMDGRYIEEHFTSDMMGQPFVGRSILGYDNVKGKYVSIWFDNMGTGISQMEGTYDEATKTLTTSGISEMKPGEKTKMRMTDKEVEKDTHMMEMYMSMGEGAP